MSDPGSDLVLIRRVRTMQIIIGAWVAGLVCFAAIAIYLRVAGGMGAAPATTVVTYVAVAWTFIAVLASSFVPALVTKAARRKFVGAAGAAASESEQTTIPAEKWYELYQTQLIVSGAFLEGAGFLCLIAYLIEGQPVMLGFALFLVITILLRLPSRERIERWIDNQQQLLDRDRQAV